MVSNSVMEWVAGRQPRHTRSISYRSSDPRPQPFLRRTQVTVHVDTSESGFDSSDTSADKPSFKKRVRFKDEETGPSPPTERSTEEREARKRSSLKKSPDKIKQSDDSSSGEGSNESDCSSCKSGKGECGSQYKTQQQRQGPNQNASKAKIKENIASKQHSHLQKGNKQAQQYQARESNQINIQHVNRSGTSWQIRNPYILQRDNQHNRSTHNNSSSTSLSQSRNSQRRPCGSSDLIRKMVHTVIQPSRADVVLREDVVECPSDPRPNAFFDSKTGVLRVYHGAVYGNPYATLVPSTLHPISIGTFAPHAGQFAASQSPSQFGGPPPMMRMPPGAYQQPSTPQQQRNSPAQQRNSPVLNNLNSNNHDGNISSPVVANMPGSWNNEGNDDSGSLWDVNNSNQIAGSGWNNGNNQNSGSGWNGNNHSQHQNNSNSWHDGSNGNRNKNHNSNNFGSGSKGNSWGDSNNRNSPSNNSGLENNGGDWDNSNNKNSPNKSSSFGTNGKSWGGIDTNSRSGNNEDSWGAPLAPAPWGNTSVAQNDSGNNNSNDSWDNNNSGNNDNGGDHQAWGTETGLSGGSWANGGVGPTTKSGW